MCDEGGNGGGALENVVCMAGWLDNLEYTSHGLALYGP